MKGVRTNRPGALSTVSSTGAFNRRKFVFVSTETEMSQPSSFSFERRSAAIARHSQMYQLITLLVALLAANVANAYKVGVGSADMTGPAAQVNFMVREGFLTSVGGPQSAEFWLRFYRALDRSPRAKTRPSLNSKYLPLLITPSSPRASKFLHYGNSNSQPMDQQEILKSLTLKPPLS